MRSTSFVKANEAVIRAGVNAFTDRRRKKREFRSLWIIRLNAACRAEGVRYSTFIKALKDKKIGLNRKVLSELAIHDMPAFQAVMKAAGVK